jgi:hypothetical protein
MINYLLLFIYLLIKGSEGKNMLVRLYASEIISGGTTFDQVPAKLQDGVRAYLFNLGLDENGDPIVV